MLINKVCFFIFTSFSLYCMDYSDQIIPYQIDWELIIPKKRNLSLTPLLEKIYCGTTEAITDVLELIEHGADVNEGHREFGTTPLMYAVNMYKDNYELILKLLDKKARINDIDKHNFTALMYALKKANKKVLHILLSKGANVNNKLLPLSYAVIEGNFEKVKKLLLKGEVDSPISDYNFSAFMWAIERGNRKIAEALLHYCVIDIDKPNMHNETALMLAIKQERLDLVSLLLSTGVNPKISLKVNIASTSPETWKNPKMQWDILNLIDIFSDDDVRKYVLNKEKYCADFIEYFRSKNTFSRFKTGQTLLMVAAINNDITTIKNIINVKPSCKLLNAKDKTGSTALIYAAKCNNTLAVQELADHVGTGVFLKTIFKKNAMDYALDYNNTKIFIRLFKAYLKVLELRHTFPLSFLKKALTIALEKENKQIMHFTVISLVYSLSSLKEQQPLLFT